MEYKIILNDNEIEKIFEIEKKCHNLGEIIKELKNEFEKFDMYKSKKSQFIMNWVIGVNGKLEKNPKDLFCPNCNGKYVVRTYAGDLYYRLLNGSVKQKNEERKKFANMGLHCNPWATEGENTRDFICLNCATRWNGKGENLINEQ